MLPFVTAIVPNYNHARFLHRRLESIYNQTYPNLRVILLDDASTDCSREILESYRHHPLTQVLLYNEINSGSPFKQWLKGLEIVETEWVWMAESDDWCALDFLECLSPGLANPDCVLAYAGLYWAQPDGRLIKQASPPEPTAWHDGKDFVKKNLFGWNRLQNSGMLVFRKTGADRVNRDWVQLLQAGDYRLWAALLPQGKVYGCGKYLCYMTRHAGSVTAKHYGGEAAQQETIDTWWEMEKAGCIRKKDIRERIEATLVGLVGQRKYMDPNDWVTRYQWWLAQLEPTGYRPRPIYWKVQALKNKVVHFKKRLNKTNA